MNILVTGGAGFIGSHTCEILLEKGYSVTLLDSFINSSKKSIEGIQKILEIKKIKIKNKFKVYKGDIRDKKFIEMIFLEAIQKNEPIKSVIHFAGLKSVSESIQNPMLYWTNNVIGSINLAQVMDKFHCKSLVFSSSATIYDSSNSKLIKEKHLTKPISPYGINKEVIEKFFNDVFSSDPSSWKIINLRYFNPIGAHPSGIIGESPISISTNIFPIICKVARGEIKELNIFGNDWPTKDGTGVRDYIHVMDIAEGHIKAIEYLLNNLPQVLNINLGSGIGTSVLELIQTFENTNQVKIPYSFAPRRKGDKGFVVADNKFAKKVLNWEPKKNLEEMCFDGWNYLLKN